MTAPKKQPSRRRKAKIPATNGYFETDGDGPPLAPPIGFNAPAALEIESDYPQVTGADVSSGAPLESPSDRDCTFPSPPPEIPVFQEPLPPKRPTRSRSNRLPNRKTPEVHLPPEVNPPFTEVGSSIESEPLPFPTFSEAPVSPLMQDRASLVTHERANQVVQEREAPRGFGPMADAPQENYDREAPTRFQEELPPEAPILDRGPGIDRGPGMDRGPAMDRAPGERPFQGERPPMQERSMNNYRGPQRGRRPMGGPGPRGPGGPPQRGRQRAPFNEGMPFDDGRGRGPEPYDPRYDGRRPEPNANRPGRVNDPRHGDPRYFDSRQGERRNHEGNYPENRFDNRSGDGRPTYPGPGPGYGGFDEGPRKRPYDRPVQDRFGQDRLAQHGPGPGSRAYQGPPHQGLPHQGPNGPRRRRVPGGPAFGPGRGPAPQRPNPFEPAYNAPFAPGEPAAPLDDENFLPGDPTGVPSDLIPAAGILEIHPSKGHGFLRNPAFNLASHPTDIFVPPHLIQRFNLREGLKLGGFCDPRNQPGQGPRLLRIDTVEDMPLADYTPREFDTLTPIDPHERIVLETGREPITTRVMDLLTPIGRGQRGLIVAPPRTGKTVLLQHIAKAVSTNNPDMHLIVLLIDERPEEVTEMKRTVRGDVLASSSDKDASQHVRLAELVLNRARRLAEMGKPVFILLDSLTRLARAYNKASNSGRTMSGGVDSKALDIPKKLFGCARVFEEGGSITVMGTALIETGSRMDEVIFQELKGTGNMELVLDRKLADRRIYPAIDIGQSGTRKEEKLLGELAPRIATLRRVLVDQAPVEGMDKLVRKLAETETNEAFLDKMIVKKK